MSTLGEEREKARRFATTVVSAAIGVVGVTLVLFSILVVVRGGAGLLFLAVILFGIGAFLALLGFFFQLVPFRLQELEEEKREHDRLRREERRARAEEDGPGRAR